MFKSTLFIAVKCCQCSTMQVKQQKKSSNKWNCAVCNQKQSVKKVYAQGYQAKDIRKFVQSFNMSRKFDDELQLQQDVSSLEHFVEHLEGDQETGEKKAIPRTDWTEYLEDETNVEPAYLKSKFNENQMIEVEVVKFSEDLMFKKPKSKGTMNSSSFGSVKNLIHKPMFSKREVSTKEIGKAQLQSSSIVVPSVWDECNVDDSGLVRHVKRHCDEQRQDKAVTMMKSSASKWSQCMLKDDFLRDNERHSELQQQQQQPKRMMKGSASKWSVYMTEDDGDGDGGGDKGVTAAFADDLRLMRGYNMENEGLDQLFEEDIHPDFM